MEFVKTKDKIQNALSELNKFGYSKELASAIVANMKFDVIL
jgi:hypothetical protein